MNDVNQTHLIGTNLSCYYVSIANQSRCISVVPTNEDLEFFFTRSERERKLGYLK